MLDPVGVWCFVAGYAIAEDTGERIDLYGADPRGYGIFERGGRMMALLEAGGRVGGSDRSRNGRTLPIRDRLQRQVVGGCREVRHRGGLSFRSGLGRYIPSPLLHLRRRDHVLTYPATRASRVQWPKSSRLRGLEKGRVTSRAAASGITGGVPDPKTPSAGGEFLLLPSRPALWKHTKGGLGRAVRWQCWPGDVSV
jgi:hypothetical protein